MERRLWIVVAGILAAIVMVRGTIRCDHAGSSDYLRLWPRSPYVVQLVNNLTLARTMDLTTLRKLQNP